MVARLPLGVNSEYQGKCVLHCQYWDDKWEYQKSHWVVGKDNYQEFGSSE
uniref:Uncharacterized protein n=1 Tax=Arundo donax TaxID=35708 RepID=A0A0A9H490_ARUDO